MFQTLRNLIVNFRFNAGAKEAAFCEECSILTAYALNKKSNKAEYSLMISN